MIFSGFVSLFAFAEVDTISPTAPANLVSTLVSFAQINVSWDVSTDTVGVAGYEIFKNGTLLYTTTGNAISVTNGIVPGINYEFKVRAFDTAGNRSDFSNYLFVMTPFDTTPPSAPYGLTATLVTTSRIDISWNASTDNVGVTKYEIYKDGTKEGTVSNGITNYSFPYLHPKTKYSFSVRSLDGAGGTSTMSEIFSTTTRSTIPPPEAPTGLSAKIISSSQVNLSWNSPPNSMYVAGYKIYKNDVFSLTSKTNIFSYTGLSPDTVYSFKVTAYNSSDDESGFSNIALATTTASTVVTPTATESTTTTVVPPSTIVKDITAPAVPTAITATAVSSSKISLSWKASSDNVKVSGYNIFRNSAFVASVSGTSYSDLGRTANKTYSYQITAYDTSGNISARSVAVSATTQSSPTSPISTTLPTNVPVTFSVIVGKGVCKSDGTTYAPVTFRTDPSGSGTFNLTGRAIETQTFESKTYELKNGAYNWKGTPNPRYVSSGGDVGTFIVPFLVCSAKSVVTTEDPTVPSIIAPPVESPSIQGFGNEDVIVSEKPLEVFATYAETNIALKKEANIVILSSFTPTEKLDAIQNIRDGYALAPQDRDVTIGKMVFSRISSPEKAIAKVQEILKGRTPELALIDTDGDGMSDYDEISIYGTDPKMKDTDGDEISDDDEVLAGTNPLEKNIAPVAYENPKTNTVFATTSPEIFTVNTTEAILSPAIGGGASKVVGVIFTGKALPNSFVTLYIFSTPIVVTIKADNDGQWEYIVDKELENGKHDIYLAMTESSGKIIAKSTPIPFVKSAEAVSLGSVLPIAEMAVSTKQGFLGGSLTLITIGAIALLVIIGLITISIIRKRKVSFENSKDDNQ
jgi:chitodextrinase